MQEWKTSVQLFRYVSTDLHTKKLRFNDASNQQIMTNFC